jgi:hypothetical protein
MAKTTRVDQDALAGLLGRQCGVISRAQAAVCGMTRGTLRHRVRPGGPWQPLLPGVYLAHTGTPTGAQREMAALLLAGPDGMLTGVAALGRHGFRVPPPAVIDVLVPASRAGRGAGFARIRRTTRMPLGACSAGKILYAPAARAVADAVRWAGDARQARAMVAEAVQRGCCPLTLIAEELGAGPVRGSARLRRVLAEVTGGVRSVAESDFLALIRRARLPDPVLNPRLYAGDTFIAAPDCWWPQAGVAAEVDSREWHLAPGDWERTMARHARMSSHGIIVMHFTPAQIRREPEAVAGMLGAALTAARDRPALPVSARPAR